MIRTRNPGLDWVMIGAVLALVTIGSLLVWSATSHRDDLTMGDPAAYLKKQVVNICIGLVLMVVVTATDYRWVRSLAPFVYLASVGGLVLVLTNGSTINGSRSWIQLGGMSVQPSEFAKLAVVIGMALLVAERTEGRRRPVGIGAVLGMLAIAAVPSALIMLQPDLGTMLVLSATVFGVLAVAGTPRRWLALLLAGGVTAAVAMVAGGFLKAYQVDRFLAFTNPDLDPRGAGYNTEQARIAVGNGGLFGQGLFHGSQTQSGFVPEQHTDFVFTVAGEELGLVGAGLVIALLCLVIWRALAIASHHARRLRPGRGGRHRLLVRVPDLPEHRHVPGHHARDRSAPAVRVVRRVVAVRRHARHRPAPEHRHPRARAVPRVQGHRRTDDVPGLTRALPRPRGLRCRS